MLSVTCIPILQRLPSLFRVSPGAGEGCREQLGGVRGNGSSFSPISGVLVPSVHHVHSDVLTGPQTKQAPARRTAAALVKRTVGTCVV